MQLQTDPDPMPRCHVFCDGRRMTETCTVCGAEATEGQESSCEHSIERYYYDFRPCRACLALTGGRSVEVSAPMPATHLRLVGG